MNRQLRVIVLFLLMAELTNPTAFAGGCARRALPANLTLSENGIRLVGDTSSAVTAAANQWNNCGGMIPAFATNQSPPFPTPLVTVHLSLNPVTTPCGPVVCGCTNLIINTATGTVVEGDLWAFENKTGGGTCGDQTQLIAHELGHVLGLDEACGATCLGQIMWDAAPAPSASVKPQDCTAADSIWTTDWESPNPCDWPEPPPGCDDGQGGGGWGWPGMSPVLLDLDRDGFHLTGFEDAVLFDLNADGVKDIVGWTNPKTRDAFIWLDRNGNGMVDDGSELFGDHTPLQDGSIASHGYQALAELDSPELGGNGDGYLDDDDAAFGKLLLWVDSDHDGFSDREEIGLLIESEVLRVDLSYQMLIEIDEHGNIYKYLSQAWIYRGDSIQRILTTDAFFVARGVQITSEASKPIPGNQLLQPVRWGWAVYGQHTWW